MDTEKLTNLIYQKNEPVLQDLMNATNHIDDTMIYIFIKAYFLSSTKFYLIKLNKMDVWNSIYDEYINVFFTADKYEGTPKIMEPDKCDNLQWFNIDELPENTIMRVRNVLTNMQKGIIYDDGNFSHQKAKS